MPVLLFLAVIVAQAQIQTPPRDASAPARSSPAATLSGRITEQGSGQPIARAIVMLAKPGSPTGFETVADADGRYAFTDVEPGEYIVLDFARRATTLTADRGKAASHARDGPMPTPAIHWC